MTTTEDRVTALENIILKHDERIGRLARLEERIVDMLADHDARLIAHDEELAELRRDGQKLQQIWIRIARKNGWDDLLDEEDLASS